MKTKLSKDYEYLYEEVCKGNEACCYVKDSTIRPMCRCKKTEMFNDIMFSTRGIQYGGVDSYEWEAKSEQKTLFLQECERLDVEFVVIER